MKSENSASKSEQGKKGHAHELGMGVKPKYSEESIHT